MDKTEQTVRRELPRINFRPLLPCAAGVCFGIFLYTALRFFTVEASSFLLPAIFFVLSVASLRKKFLPFFLCLAAFCGLGAGAVHLYTLRFSADDSEPYSTVRGTISEITVRDGYSEVTLSRLTLNGGRTGGKLSLVLPSEELRAGDLIEASGRTVHTDLPAPNDSSDYVADIRYSMNAANWEKVGVSSDPFLRVNAALYDLLHENMEREEAQVGYALLTGNSGSVDDGVLAAVRGAGIAHIFAVSGLHIGILYGAVSLAARPLRRFSFVPAVLVSAAYVAVCGFSVSAVRALVMCAALGVRRAAGRKPDLLSSLCLASLVVLLFRPAEWLSVGFRLSFAAVFGLAMLSGGITRALCRIHLPRGISSYLSATLSVQAFTFPVLLETYGYFSLWGILLNPVFLPVLPTAYLSLVVTAVASLIIPPAAPYFLIVPEAVLALLLFVLAVTDFSALLTGISLGAGGMVIVCTLVLVSERVRFGGLARSGLALGGLCLLFACILAENAVLAGCRVDVYDGGDGELVLVRTRDCSVLILGENATLGQCRDFLRRRDTGTLDAAVALGKDEGRVINVAAFTGAAAIYACEETATGLLETELVFGKSFTVGGIDFTFESEEKLSFLAEGVVVEVDFTAPEALGADLFIGTGDAGLKFFLGYGIIYAI